MAISRIAATLGIASTLVTLATGTVVNSPAARAASSSLQFSPSSPQTRTTTTTTTHNNNNKRVTCEDVHIILARGWKEDYPGRQGVLVDAICAGQDSSACGYEDVIFDDSENSVYGPAVYQGAVAGISQVTDYATDCPNAKIVISGYSEGAHVFGDVLAGGGGDWFGTQEGSVTGLGSDATSPGSQIAAALLWGDPRHTASQSYNVISGADANGYYPRSGTNLDNLNVFSSVLRSYCLSGDEVCAGGDDDGAHTSYFEDSVGLVDDAASWVRSMVGISGTASATATVEADLPATDGVSVVAATTSTASSADDPTTVTGTAALATPTGDPDQASGASATASTSASSTSPVSSVSNTASASASSGGGGGGASAATTTSTSSPSSGVGKVQVLGQGTEVTGSLLLAVGAAWFLVIM